MVLLLDPLGNQHPTSSSSTVLNRLKIKNNEQQTWNDSQHAQQQQPKKPYINTWAPNINSDSSSTGF